MVACLLLRGAACPVPAAEDPGVGLVSRFTEASLAASSFDAGSSRRSELVLVPYDSLSNGEVDLELDMMAARTGFLVSAWGGGGIEDQWVGVGVVGWGHCSQCSHLGSLCHSTPFPMGGSCLAS